MGNCRARRKYGLEFAGKSYRTSRRMNEKNVELVVLTCVQVLIGNQKNVSMNNELAKQ